MSKRAGPYYRIGLALGAVALSAWAYYYLPDFIKLLGVAIALVLAIVYTLYALLGGQTKHKLRIVWKEMLDALYGLG